MLWLAHKRLLKFDTLPSKYLNVSVYIYTHTHTHTHSGLFVCVTCKLCQFLIGLQPQNQARLIRSNDSKDVTVGSGSTSTHLIPLTALRCSDNQPARTRTHTHTHTHKHTWSRAYETGSRPYVLQCSVLTDSDSLCAQCGAEV